MISIVRSGDFSQRVRRVGELPSEFRPFAKLLELNEQLYAQRFGIRWLVRR